MIIKEFNKTKITKSKNKIERSGYENEQRMAYLIDFDYKNLKKCAVIHDLKLNYNGRTAQIDHLIITPSLIFVIESKFSTGVIKITENNWLVSYEGNEIAVSSPIEQNERHIKVLNDLLKNEDIFPNKRFPEIKNVVAISEKTKVEGKMPKEVMLSEKVLSFIDEEYKKILYNPLKVLKAAFLAYSEDEIKDISQKLLSFDVSGEEKKEDNLLYKLKVLRTIIAKEEGLEKQQYIIFSNKTLEEMSLIIPKTKDELMKITGVGELKFGKYGNRFLEVLRNH